jgi:hypothetical protein
MRRAVFASGIGFALLVHAAIARADCPNGFDPLTGKCFDRLPPPAPGPPSLEIFSSPTGAQVSRIDPSTGNAVPLGDMPAGGYRLSPGRHRLLVSLDGYADETIDVVVAARGKTRPPAVTLTAYPRLTVRAADYSTGGDVLLDGAYIGELPLLNYPVSNPGPHTVQVKRPHHQTWERAFDQIVDCPSPPPRKLKLCWRSADSFVAELKANAGRLTVGHVAPVPALPDELVGSAVQVIQAEKVVVQGLSPVSFELPAGSYEVRMRVVATDPSAPGAAPCAVREIGSKCLVRVEPDAATEVIPRFTTFWGSPRPAFATDETKLRRTQAEAAACNAGDLTETTGSQACRDKADYVADGIIRDDAFVRALGEELQGKCRDEEYSGACSGLAYLFAHRVVEDPDGKPDQRALNLYLRECIGDRSDGCLGAAWLLRKGVPLERPDKGTTWTSVLARACGPKHIAECLYAYTRDAVDPTEFTLATRIRRTEQVVEPPLRCDPACLQFYGLAGLSPGASAPYQLDVGPAADLPWKGPLGFHLAAGFRFRSLEQVDATTHAVSRASGMGVGYEGGLAIQPTERLTLRATVRGSLYAQSFSFTDFALAWGPAASIDLRFHHTLVGFGAFYEQMPVRTMTVRAFGTDHTLSASEFRWIGFVRIAYILDKL